MRMPLRKSGQVTALLLVTSTTVNPATVGLIRSYRYDGNLLTSPAGLGLTFLPGFAHEQHFGRKYLVHALRPSGPVQAQEL